MQKGSVLNSKNFTKKGRWNGFIFKHQLNSLFSLKYFCKKMWLNFVHFEKKNSEVCNLDQVIPRVY